MTELEYIQTAPIEEVAWYLVTEDSFGFETTDGSWFSTITDSYSSAYESALAHQIEILGSEHVEQ